MQAVKEVDSGAAVTEPILLHNMQAVKEVDSLRAVVGNYEKDKTALAQSKGRLLQTEKQLKHLEWENEVHQFLVDLSQSYA